MTAIASEDRMGAAGSNGVPFPNFCAQLTQELGSGSLDWVLAAASYGTSSSLFMPSF